MPALLAALISFAGLAPLEPQATDGLRQAQQSLRRGDVGRGLATLDSLLFSDGVTVALEAPSAMADAVGRGLDVWNDALGERPFRMRPAGSDADVTVRFVARIDEDGGDAQGYVKAQREMSWSRRDHGYRLRGTILVRDNARGRRLREDEVAAVVAHEAGHLLGLADVARPDRLMGPLTLGRPNPGPFPDEVAAVAEYRSSVRRSYPNPVDKR